LHDFSRPTCIGLTTPIPPTYAPTTVDQVEPSENSQTVIPLAAGLGGGMLFLIIIIIVLLVIVLVLKKRQSKESYQVNSDFYSDLANMGPHTHEGSWMDEQPHKFTESKLDGGQQEHVYEPLPPAQDEANNPPAEASTEGDPFSNPSGDNVKFSFNGDPLDPFEPFPHHT